MSEQNPTNANNNPQEQQAPYMDDLMACLNSCTRAFLDKLVLTFNDEEVLNTYQYTHSTKKKRDTIYTTITKNPAKNIKQYEAIKDFDNFVRESADDVKEAKETMNSYRNGLRSKVNDIDNTFKIEKNTIDYCKEIQGDIECNKLIENGLKGLGKAVVAGCVLDKVDQVVASANYVMAETSRITSVQNLEDKSIEGVKTVIKRVNPTTNKIIASLHTEDGKLNALADRLAVDTKQTRESLFNKTEEVVKQTVTTSS